MKAWWTAWALTVAGPALALDAARLDYQLQPRALAPDTWVIEGAVQDFGRANGCNIINTGFIATPEGTWVINTGPSLKYGQQQRSAIARTTAQPVPLSVVPVPPCHESRCAPSITTSDERSVPGISARTLAAGTSSVR